MRVLFCGSAASPQSAALSAYYAGPGNRFWEIIYQTGIVPILIEPFNYARVKDYDVGLTDLAKYATGIDATLKTTDYDVGLLFQKVVDFTPSWLAFNGKRSAQQFLMHKVNYGRQEEKIGESKIFVLPSTSGSACRFWDESYWYELAELLLDI